MPEVVSSPWRVDQYTFHEPHIGHGFVMRQIYQEGGVKWLAYFVTVRTGEKFNVWFRTDDEALAAVNRWADQERAARKAGAEA
jgi:hypothetical protein